MTAAERIRSEGLIVKSVYVFIKTSRFKNDYVSRVQKVDLPIATNNTLELTNVCAKALENIYIKGYFYSKAGVIFSDLKPKDHYEKNLFSDQNLNLDHGIEITIDETIKPPVGKSEEEAIKIITQSMADNFAKRIKGSPVDWHMLQRIWLDEEN